MKTIEVNVISLHKMLSKKGTFYAIGEFTSSEYGIIRQFMPVEVFNQALKNKVEPGNVAYLQLEIIKGPDMSLSSKVVGLHTSDSINQSLDINHTDEINTIGDDILTVDEDMIQ